MATASCRYCRAPLAMPAGVSADAACCPHCREEREPSGTVTPCWFAAHHGKRYGPFTWQRLVTMALHGDLHPDVMLCKEKSDRWVRAGTLATLFAASPADAAPPAAVPAAPRPAAVQPMRPATMGKPAPVAAAPAAAAIATELETLLAYINALDATLKPAGTPASPTPAATAEPAEAKPTLAEPVSAKPVEAVAPEPLVPAAPRTAELCVAPAPSFTELTPPCDALTELSAAADALPQSAPEEPPTPSEVLPTEAASPTDEGMMSAEIAVPADPPLPGAPSTPESLVRRLLGVGRIPWLMEGMAAATVSVLLTAMVIAGSLMFQGTPAADPPQRPSPEPAPTATRHDEPAAEEPAEPAPARPATRD